MGSFLSEFDGFQELLLLHLEGVFVLLLDGAEFGKEVDLVVVKLLAFLVPVEGELLLVALVLEDDLLVELDFVVEAVDAALHLVELRGPRLEAPRRLDHPLVHFVLRVQFLVSSILLSKSETQLLVLVNLGLHVCLML